ncbi:hypothetical protein [Acidiplasma sp. MBA-1]|uniref:hypothetical protein n=1 Tax=Acidiplasma sp. MBA-1 TaxID=1293648 RepID=UPI0005DF54FE|nr:hypothetical protein [Acidiplasma sp. MBA-1]KJE49311.1 hypothetical protein TZ01_04460 [Acidiplasma sp. MBA-1]
MGKVLDIVLSIISILIAVYVFTRLGITLGDLIHDIKLFIYGSKASFLLGWWSKASFLLGWLN